jgi:ketosteroid isomerase-like protein
VQERVVSRHVSPAHSVAQRFISRLIALTTTPAVRARMWRRLTPERRLAALEAGYEEAWAAWRAADGDRLARFYHPDAVVDFSRFDRWPTDSVYHGHAGARKMVADWTEAWTDLEYTTRTITVAGERVLAHIFFFARGRDSGIEVDADFWQVADTSGGVAVRLTQYTDRDEALADFGLTLDQLERSLNDARQPRGSVVSAS